MKKMMMMLMRISAIRIPTMPLDDVREFYGDNRYSGGGIGGTVLGGNEYIVVDNDNDCHTGYRTHL